MTLAYIEQDIYARLSLSDAPPTRVVNRIRRFVNQRYRRILTSAGISQLREDTLTFTTIANNAMVSLPTVVARIHRIYDPVDGDKLENRSLEWIRTNEPTPALGDPEYYSPIGLRAVLQQPEVANTLFLVSTSASDTSNAVVEYYRATGERQTTEVTLTGTTPVQVGAANNIVSVYGLMLDANAVGTVSLTSSGDTLATVTPGQTDSRYLGIVLSPAPMSAQTWYVDFERNIDDLADSNDEPLIPQDFHYLLSLGARIDEYEYLDDNRREALQFEWQQGLRRLVNFVGNNPDYIVVPGGGGTAHSSLGGYYPSGS